MTEDYNLYNIKQLEADFLKNIKNIRAIRIFSGPGPTKIKRAIKNKEEVAFKTHGIKKERKILIEVLKPTDKPYIFELVAPSGNILGKYNMNTRTGYLFFSQARPIKI